LGIDLQTKDFYMDEKALIKQWNEMRSQIITSQVAPALVLIAILVVAAYDKFDTAADSAKFLALGVAAVTGFLATISQYAAIREGEALLLDLRKIEKPTALTSKIADSRGLLSLSAITIIAFDIAMFALVTWAILG
jgi:sensor c-di-GMP phosphodiesterase-like protein